MRNETTVVNLRKEPCDVYIGRPSIFGNPMHVGEKIHQKPGLVSRDEAVAWYSTYFDERIRTSQVFRDAVGKLKGKTLGCYCKPLSCHGDIIAKYLNGD